MPERVDVAIVGGGLAGLTAAVELTEAGRRVAVLEADAEVGGRTRTRWLAGQAADFGAEWVGSRHLHVMATVRRLGLRLEPGGQLGHPVLWRGHERDRSGLLPPLRPREAVTLARALWRAHVLARRVDPVEPWTSPHAGALDQRHFGQWLQEQGVSGDGFSLMSALVGSLASRPADEVSLLQPLWWIRRGGGLASTVRSTFESRVAGGAQAISTRLAERLDGSVRLGAAVAAIEQAAGSVRVHTATGDSLDAEDVVVTAPPGTLGMISFDPQLPQIQQMIDQLHIEPAAKVAAVLPTEELPRHRVVLGDSPLSSAWRAGRRVTGFAPPAGAGASDQALLDDLASCFGCTAGQFAASAVYRWRDRPFISGCAIGFGPGDLTRVGPWLRASWRRVHFAGAERGSWPNSMEGAIESGVRVSRRLLAPGKGR